MCIVIVTQQTAHYACTVVAVVISQLLSPLLLLLLLLCSFYYNPQPNDPVKTYWWTNNPALGGPYPGTGQTCDITLPKYVCKIGGQEVATCQVCCWQQAGTACRWLLLLLLCACLLAQDASVAAGTTCTSAATCCAATSIAVALQDTEIGSGGQVPFKCPNGTLFNSESISTTLTVEMCCLVSA
jgi:hypothetical protein